jgi:D-isomer specific 2-hydroxyacid dehydrogenase, NAD binding domain
LVARRGARARHITQESASLRSGGWQVTVGDDLATKTLGIVGLGSVGSQVAKVGLAIGKPKRRPLGWRALPLPPTIAYGLWVHGIISICVICDV